MRITYNKLNILSAVIYRYRFPMCSRRVVACCFLSKVFAVIFVALFLVACGGGGGSDEQGSNIAVLTHFPANSETDVKLDSTIEISFSGSLDPATITESSVTLNENTLDNITYDESTNTLVLTPLEPLTSRTRYRVNINGLKDIDGNELSSFSWTFYTEDVEPPIVYSHTPAVNSHSFANNSPIKIYFDEIVDADSVNNRTIYIDGGVDATVTPDYFSYTTSATLTPNEPLIKGRTYTVNVSGVKDYAGNEMSELYSWDFTLGWDEATRVDPVKREGESSNAKVVTDENGNAFVTWKNDGTILMNHHVAGRGWGGIQELYDGYARSYDIVINAKGDVFFVWVSGAGMHVKSYSPQSGWADPVEITPTISEWFDLSIDEAGNAVVVWLSGSPASVYGRAFTVDGGWQDKVALESFNAADSIAPKVNSDESGNAIVIWEQGGGIWANRYELGVGWGDALLLADDETPNFMHDVSVNSSGQAVVAWQQSDGGIRVINYAPETGWEENATNIGFVDTSGRYSIHVKLDDDGRAIVVEGYSGKAFRYTPESGWREHDDINGYNGRVYGVRLEMEDSGDAIATWVQPIDERHEVYANYFSVDRGWEGAMLISEDGNSPRVAINEQGNALLVWKNEDIFSRALVKGQDTTPPIVTNHSPLTNASNLLNTNLEIDMVFSEALDPLSINSSTITISNNAIVTMNYDNETRTVTLIPETDLIAGATYTVTVSGVADVAGNVMSEPYTWDFTVGWGNFTFLLLENATRFKWAVSDSGHVLVVWLEYEEGGYRVMGNKYNGTEGWSEKFLIADTHLDKMSLLEVAINNHGDAVVVWGSYDDNYFASIFKEGSGWASPEAVAVSPEWWSFLGGFDLAISDNGEVAISWEMGDDFYVRRYSMANGWGDEIIMGENYVSPSMRMEIDSSGNIAVAWIHEEETGYGVSISHYIIGVGWQEELVLARSSYLYPFNMAMDMNDSGQIILCWYDVDIDLARGVVDCREYDPLTGWGVEQRVINGYSGGGLSVVIGSGGDAALITYSGAYGSIVNLYRDEKGWLGQRVIGWNGDIGKVAVDEGGNAIILAYLDNEPDDGWPQEYVHAYRFNTQIGWESEVQISDIDTGGVNITDLDVVLNEAGNGIAIWFEPSSWSEPTSKVWLRHFTAH